VHVYLPTTMTGLAVVLADAVVRPAPVAGFAVTDGLRAELPGEDDEELEYATSARAAAASLVRLAGDPSAPRRRVVLVVDVDESLLQDHDGLEVGAVQVREVVPLTRVVSALVDDGPVAPFVARVLADPGAPNAASDLEDHQLLWYAAQELPALVAESFA